MDSELGQKNGNDMPLYVILESQQGDRVAAQLLNDTYHSPALVFLQSSIGIEK